MQKKIDEKYEKKLKEVGDEALKKLKAFQDEHKQLQEKTNYMMERTKYQNDQRIQY